jgi:hypothetical protein
MSFRTSFAGPPAQRRPRQHSRAQERDLARARDADDHGFLDVERARVAPVGARHLQLARRAVPGRGVDHLAVGREAGRVERAAPERDAVEGRRRGRLGRSLPPEHEGHREQARARDEHEGERAAGPRVRRGRGQRRRDGSRRSIDRRLRPGAIGGDRTRPLAHDRARRLRLDGAGHPAVAAPRQRFDVARSVGVVAERRADLADAEAERLLEVDEGARGPDLGLISSRVTTSPGRPASSSRTLSGWGCRRGGAIAPQLAAAHVEPKGPKRSASSRGSDVSFNGLDARCITDPRQLDSALYV